MGAGVEEGESASLDQRVREAFVEEVTSEP